MKKKVLFFLYALSGGGAERTVVNIINNLNKDKYDIVLVLGTNKNNDYINILSSCVDVKVLGSSKLRFTFFKLIRCIKNEEPDLLFSTINANNLILILARLFSLKKTPIIVREASNRTQSGNVTRLNRIITSYLYNSVPDKVIALSYGVKDDLIKNFRITENKIEVIYNPVEIEKINKLGNEKVSDIYQEKGEKLLIAVGRLAEQKDFATLIKAFHIVYKEVKSKLIIVGKGQQEEKLKRLSNELGLKDKIIFTGFLENPYKYIKKADVFILSSKWEGFGHVIVEAMASSTPVIATDCNSGPAEIIEENKYGLLVPVKDYKVMANKTIQLLKNECLINKYIERGFKRANEFNAKNIVKKYENLFDNV